MSLDDAELELFARHLSLPEVGAQGQARLLSSKVFVGDDVPAREALLIALARSGIEIVSAPEDADLRVESAGFGAPGVVDFSAGQVDVGPFDFQATRRLEASAALAAKERWLGAILASEIVLYLVKERAEPFSLVLDYPHYSARR
jgi:hypothetical protein